MVSFGTTAESTSHETMPYVEKSLLDHTTTSPLATPGIEKTKELVLREFWWPKMKKDIETYVRPVRPANERKAVTKPRRHHSIRMRIHPTRGLTSLWIWLQGLPKSNGHDAILVIVDRFSKEIIPVACSTELTSEKDGQRSCTTKCMPNTECLRS